MSKIMPFVKYWHNNCYYLKNFALMRKIFILLIIILFVENKGESQIVKPVPPACPNDSKLTYDDFEKFVIEIKTNCKIELLPNYRLNVELCKSSTNPKRCLDELMLDAFLENNTNISLSTDEKEWLLDHPYILCELPTIRISYPNLDLDYVIQILSTNPNVELSDLIEGSRLWGPDNKYNPEVQLPTFLIIEFLGIPNTNPLNTLIASTPDRRNYIDLDHSSQCQNGDTYKNIIPIVKPWSIEDHKNEMIDLMTDFSTFTLEDVAIEMANTFFINNNAENHFHFENLSSAAYATPEMHNFIVKFGEMFHLKLKEQNGDVSKVIAFDISNVFRPKFSAYQVTGLTICINDTEKSSVYYSPTTYTYDPTTKYWECEFTFLVIDHFGLDNDDVLSYQNWNEGFASWWMLQHCYDFKPFITDIRFKVKLKGFL